MSEEAAKWGGFSLEVPPPFLEPIISAINDTLEMLVIFLDIVLVVIDICKVFLLGLLSPILGILDALIALIESLANDLRKAGLYLRGDWDTWVHSSDWKDALQSLEGGYGAFEARAFNWLTDSSDPTRPDFSTASGVLGLFFYMGVDYSDVMKAYQAIMGLIKFFSNVAGGKFLSAPADVKSEFVSEFGFGGNLKDHWESPDAPPTRANLTWGFAASPAKAHSMPITPLPPECCIVEISTFPGGWWPGYSRPKAGSTGASGKKENGFLQAPLDIGGGPLRIYGGSACLVKDKQYLGGDGGVNTPAGAKGAGIWLVKSPSDKEPVYLNELIKAEASEGFPIGQKQHVIHMNAATRIFFPSYEFKLVQEEMPHGIKSVSKGVPTPEDDPARDIWVSVASGGEGVGNDDGPKWSGDEEKNEGQSGFKITNISNSVKPVKCESWPELNSRSRSSQEIKISFPSDAKKTFMQMVQNAAVIALLCRGDLDADSEKEAAASGQKVTNFKPIAGTLNKGLGSFAPWSDWGPGIESRTKLAVAANAVAEEFSRMASGIPESVFEGLVEQHRDALLFTMKEFEKVTNASYGTAPYTKDIGNGVTGGPYYFGAFEDDTLYQHCNRFNTFSEKTPGCHMMRLAWCHDSTYATRVCDELWETHNQLGVQAATYGAVELKKKNSLPVFVGMKTSAMAREEMGSLGDEKWITEFKKGNAVAIPARNLFSADVLDSALTILNIATRISSEGNWIVIRPLDTFLQPVEEFIEKLLSFLKGLREGLLAIIQQILNYIKMIESRIMEIQQLIRRIQGILRMLGDFKISADFQMLVVTGAGTQGLISEFMTSEAKPSGSPEEVGHGAVVVAGGLPLVILDLIKAILAAREAAEGADGDGDGVDAAALLADEGV